MPLRANFLKAVGIIGGVREARKILQTERDAKNASAPPPSGPTPAHPVSVPAGAAGHDTDMSHIHGPIGYAKELFTRFSADLCPSWAASLSFFAMLSIVPVLLCGLAVLGFLVQNPKEAADYVQNIVANLLPGGTAQETAQSLIAQAGIEKSAENLMKTRGTAGIIGVLSLFWSALQIFLCASTPMNAAFRTKEARGFVKLRLVSLGLLFGAGFLFLVSLIPAAGAHYFNGYARGHLFEAAKPVAALVVRVIAVLAGIVINAAMFTVIYRFLPSPSARVTWREAGVAGGVVAVLSEIAKEAFATYLTKFGQQGYNKLYGSLGGLIALIFWIYYSSMILLLGAEIAKLYADAQAAKKAKTKPA